MRHEIIIVWNKMFQTSCKEALLRKPHSRLSVALTPKVLKDCRMDGRRGHFWNVTQPRVQNHFNQTRGKT